MIRPETGPHHAPDTVGRNTVVVEVVVEHAVEPPPDHAGRKGRPVRSPSLPPDEPKPADPPPPAN